MTHQTDLSRYYPKRAKIASGVLALIAIAPTGWAQPAPSASTDLLKLPGWEAAELRPGLVHYQREFDDLFGGPQIANVLAVDPASPAVRLQLTAADVWHEKRQPIPDLASKIGAVAAINGGFAPSRRHPEVGYGIMKFNGQVWPFVNDHAFHKSTEGLGRSAVGIDREGGWHFASRGGQADALRAHWDADWPGVHDAMAGGSLLVIDGQVNPLVTENGATGAYLEDQTVRHLTFKRHPRTAIGVTPENIAVLVAIDGRHAGRAAGMTLHEVGQLMVKLGCTDAMELDGGGSTTMWLADAPGNGVVNHPTDNKTFDHEGLRPLRLAVVVMPREMPQEPAAKPTPKLKVSWTPILRGVDEFTFDAKQPYPIVGHALRIDTQAPGISFVSTPPLEAPRLGEQETRSQTASSFFDQHDVEVAVNASTFGPVVKQEGLPQDIHGLGVSRGELVSAPESRFPAFAVTADNRPFFIEAGAQDQRAYHAVAGFFPILKNGQVIRDDDSPGRPARGQHPRTAFGLDQHQRFLYLLVIDGRQPGYSEGVYLDTLAHLLQELGAYDGLNMDGGGSTALVVRDPDGTARVVNRPIHTGVAGIQRPNGNHLGIHADPLTN